MDLGLSIPILDIDGGTTAIAPELARAGAAAEAAGATSLWFMDHFFQMDWMAPAQDPMLEGYTALGFAAGTLANAYSGGAGRAAEQAA